MAEVTRSRGSLLRLVALVGVIASGGLLVAFTPLGSYLSRDGIDLAISWLRASRAAPLFYIAAYTFATAFAIPGSILTLAGGAMFGVVQGSLYTTIGANLGANAAFGIARMLGRDGVTNIGGSRLDALDRAAESHGFQGLLSLRLIPVVPFNALNFGSGLTSISWSTYAIATAIGILPGTIVYTMFADALLAGSREASREALLRVLLSGALLILLSFLPAIARRLGVKVPGASAAVVGLTTLALLRPIHTEAQTLPSHQPFSEILAEVVSQPAVDYAQLVALRADLAQYLSSLGDVEAEAIEGASREEQLAFWINAYNACMLSLVADNYPIAKDGRLLSRIRNSVAGRPVNSVWQIPDVFSAAHCRIAGVDRSQDDMEHGIIRPMGDPRIHFAVNCAAVSCPVLWPEAYQAESLDAQLDRAVARLIDTPAHFSVERSTIRLNQVLDWFRDDFGGEEGLREFFARYTSTDVAALLSDPDTKIEFFEYDWTLNDTGN
jgi:uncharacterized membrane protein YdjX (TVP38/TMEM64 family)